MSGLEATWESDGSHRTLFEGTAVTPREIRIARTAWLDGNCSTKECNMDRATEVARRLYPLPKVTRQRVVRDGSGWEFKCADERFYYRRADSLEPWSLSLRMFATPENVLFFADLLARPTEEVDAE